MPEAVERAKQKGFRCLWVPTSCEMILATRDPARFAELQKLFPEGIEDRDQLLRLRALGCRIGQGFLLSRPVGVDIIEALLAAAGVAEQLFVTHADA